eukprot:Clim_evm93s157 gene=Clim_evmTU93s157
MEPKFAVVTGATSGIGKALAVYFSQKGIVVIAAGRRTEKLKDTQQAGKPDMIHPVTADVSTVAGRDAIVDAVKKLCPKKLNFLINNAGVLGQVAAIGRLDEQAFMDTLSTNVAGPLFLTQGLLNQFAEGARVLNISSGAAHGPNPGWTAYCTSKAALYMVSRCLQRELGSKGLSCGSMKPGVVDTEIQDNIREADVSDFPNLDYFKNLKTNAAKSGTAGRPPPTGGLDTPENVAHFALFLLTEASTEEFVEKDWDIRDDHHHGRWISA